MVQGVPRFKAKLRNIPVAIRAEVVKAMEASASDLVRAMRATAPRDTGALLSSIDWTWGSAPAGAITVGELRGRSYEQLRITIYAGGTAATARLQRRGVGRSGSFVTDVARLQEFGTVNMRANPFFYPVWRANKRLVRGRITRAVRRGIRKLNRTK